MFMFLGYFKNGGQIYRERARVEHVAQIVLLLLIAAALTPGLPGILSCTFITHPAFILRKAFTQLLPISPFILSLADTIANFTVLDGSSVQLISFYVPIPNYHSNELL